MTDATDVVEIGRGLLIVGDCVEAMEAMPEASIDAIVTDPPYGLEFMGEAWDAPWRDKAIVADPATEGGAQDGAGGNAYSRSRVRYQNAWTTTRARDARAKDMDDPVKAKYLRHNVSYDRRPSELQAFHHRWCVAALRVLKPGGYLVAMSGTRTYHRLACAAEDAGFEIREMVTWTYGSGFPKSHNLRGEHEGRGTALKPSNEPCLVARVPFRGSIADNVEAHGTGALNVDACRVPVSDDDPVNRMEFVQNGERTVYGNFSSDGRRDMAPKGGRWPPRTLLDPAAAEEMDRQSGPVGGAAPASGPTRTSTSTSTSRGVFAGTQAPPVFHGAAEGASRFFPVFERDHEDAEPFWPFRYVAKPARAEREAGLHDAGDRRANVHPTVKPVALMRWLARLVTPPGGVCLDPFAGSGTTPIACEVEGIEWIGVERDPSYAEISRTRIAWWHRHGDRAVDVAREIASARAKDDPDQMRMFK